jgi:hypothetical protein
MLISSQHSQGWSWNYIIGRAKTQDIIYYYETYLFKIKIYYIILYLNTKNIKIIEEVCSQLV